MLGGVSLNDFMASFLAERRAAFFEQQRRVVARAFGLPKAVALATETRAGFTPHDVVFESGTLRLLRYRQPAPVPGREPILFCYALINRPYILDLLPGKSVVERFLERGFEVYMIDWGVPSDADRGLTLHDYVSRMAGAIEHIQGAHSLPQLHLLGYCMGGTLATLLTALEPQLVRTLTLLAAPIDFSGRESLLNVWTNRRQFDVDAFVDAHGNCPASFLQACFLYMKPVENLLEKQISLYEQLDDPSFLALYFALERWVGDNIPVAGETFREFVKNLYQQNELVRGELTVGGRRVDLRRIQCPLLLLTAKNDHLVAPASTERVREYVRSRDVTAMSIDAGHVGMVVSGRAHKTLWPSAVAWLAQRAGTQS